MYLKISYSTGQAGGSFALKLTKEIFLSAQCVLADKICTFTISEIFREGRAMMDSAIYEKAVKHRMKPTIYLICQVSEPKSVCPSLLERWPFSGQSAILQADHLSDSMRWLLLQLTKRFPNADLQYFTQNTAVSGEERQFLLSLEERGMSVSIERECSVGMSLYAARRRCRYHIERADAVLMICDQMTTEIQNLIRFAEKSHIAASVLCCKDS